MRLPFVNDPAAVAETFDRLDESFRPAGDPANVADRVMVVADDARAAGLRRTGVLLDGCNG